ncbi:hypothetical protein RHS01_10290 [Rhizoctonia solani]|uniref:Uncharacterized protein n=1 Tax=Rhizoctonia solani TaxID=456999 RepID=A0A8H7I5N8_9AGAM|nr:hypothetical protein RHS01_10290 [Rhizoctonia solani]
MSTFSLKNQSDLNAETQGSPALNKVIGTQPNESLGTLISPPKEASQQTQHTNSVDAGQISGLQPGAQTNGTQTNGPSQNNGFNQQGNGAQFNGAYSQQFNGASPRAGARDIFNMESLVTQLDQLKFNDTTTIDNSQGESGSDIDLSDGRDQTMPTSKGEIVDIGWYPATIPIDHPLSTVNPADLHSTSSMTQESEYHCGPFPEFDEFIYNQGYVEGGTGTSATMESGEMHQAPVAPPSPTVGSPASVVMEMELNPGSPTEQLQQIEGYVRNFRDANATAMVVICMHCPVEKHEKTDLRPTSLIRHLQSHFGVKP